MLIHNPKDLSAFLRDRRRSLKLSQATVGALVNLKQATVSELERHAAGSKLETIFRILAANDLELHLIPKEDHPSEEKNAWDKEW